ncbi:anti-sigma factor [Nocardia sp. NBC_01327]|uniref:anti-sigma factor n=1 Tax=Nocardia sp. NBC_01327 TaxID=2903593 RepID=UPI002E12042F|nr:anti-sigma factor [Nocardia sp. NBC_01327]
MNDGVAQDHSIPTTVGLQVPAAPQQLSLLRALAETVTLLADFDIGEVNDIRLVLDEVAMLLVRDAVPGTALDCDLTYDSDGVTVRVAAVASSATALDDHSLSWHIVRTLTDSVRTVKGLAAVPAAGYPTVVEFRWLRNSRG